MSAHSIFNRVSLLGKFKSKLVNRSTFYKKRKAKNKKLAPLGGGGRKKNPFDMGDITGQLSSAFSS